MKNILITGGAGFIGSNLALKLIDRGYQITVLDNLSPQIHGEVPELSSPIYSQIKDKVVFLKGSVTSRQDWISALTDQDAVIHLAAETGTGQSMYEISKYVDVNIGGTAIMLDLLANEFKDKILKVIVSSSRAIYGEGKYFCQEHGVVYPTERNDSFLKNADFECKCPHCEKSVQLLPTCEESKIHPTSVYGITKQNQEQMVMVVCKSIGIPAVAFRYQNVYGPGQSLSNPYTGILSIFSTRMKNNNPIAIFEDGNESRDFVYIDDVVDATILGLESSKANNSIFNVGSAVSTSVFEVAQLLRNFYNIPAEITVTGNYRLGDIRHNVADLKNITNVLGFTPKFSFERGLKLFCDWVNLQELKIDNFELSIKEMKEKGLYK